MMLSAYGLISILVLALLADSVIIRDDSFIIRSGLEDPETNGKHGIDELVEDLRRRTKRRDLDPKTCLENFDVQRDKIIRTEESREMGAKYLLELDVGSREECLRLCCETDTCDVFVFEEKSPGSCYLFKCGPPEDFKCKFTRHGNFSSGLLTVSRRVAELEDRARLAKHEQDLASLRKAAAVLPSSTATSPPQTPPAPITTTTTAATVLATTTRRRRCSRFQFECHGSGECIAIYNACDGIAQCADASDEAVELGCPPIRPPPPPPPVPTIPYDVAVQEGGEMKLSASEALSGNSFARPPPGEPGPVLERAWPHRLTQAQPQPQLPKLYPEGVSGSRIFNHKGGLQVMDTEVNPPQSYIPYDQIQETQWSPHRQWQQQLPIEPMPVNEHPMMYRYPQEQPPGAVPQQTRTLGSGPAQITAAEHKLDRLPQPGVSNVMPDRDKMWLVPQAAAAKLEPPFYSPTKTMPETQAIFTKQQEFMHDGPKKGINRTNKNDESERSGEQQSSNGEKERVETERDETEIEKLVPETVAKQQKTPAPTKISENKTKKKHLKEENVVVESKETHLDPDSIEHQQTHHSSNHIQYLITEADHDGLSDKPPGAFLLLTLGVTMTVIMGVMLGCRLKMARRRMRRAGKSPFAHDADYLVNGMYL